MQGSFDEARELVGRRAARCSRSSGCGVRVARVAQEAWRVEMLAGDVEAAERRASRMRTTSSSTVGEKYLLSTVSGLLGQTMYALGRFDEVEELGRLAHELATEDDVDTQALWRCVQAKVLARDGSLRRRPRHSSARHSRSSGRRTLFSSRSERSSTSPRFSGSPADADVRGRSREARRLAETKESPVMVDGGRALLAAAAGEPLARPSRLPEVPAAVCRALDDDGRDALERLDLDALRRTGRRSGSSRRGRRCGRPCR